MINRPITETDLHAYVDGQLPPERATEVESHLAVNSEDAAHVSAWRKQNDALDAALTRVLDEPIPSRLAVEPLARSKFNRLSWMRRYRSLIAASIAFVAGSHVGAGSITLAVHSPLWPTAATDAAATMARAALDAHRVFIPEILHPVEISSAQEGHLVRGLSRRLSFPMRLPDLKPEGFTLVGGRLLSGPDGPAALFMFENAAGTRLTLYCGRLKPVTDTAFRYSDAGGVRTIYWTSDDIGFALTGAVVRDTLQRIAQLVFAVMEQEPKRPS
jgi:anti-sigma factor RsiW